MSEFKFGQTPVLGQGLGVDFILTSDTNDNKDNNGNANDNNNDKKNPHLNFLKGTLLRDKAQG